MESPTRLPRGPPTPLELTADFTNTKSIKTTITNRTKAMAVFKALTPPANSIQFDPPFPVRFDCKLGQVKIGDRPCGSKLDFIVVGYSTWFGNLGETLAESWGQLFYVVIPPSGKKADRENAALELPLNTVCVSYFKTRSLDGFNRLLIPRLTHGENPEDGVFSIRFDSHQRQIDGGTYYSVAFDWREAMESEADLFSRVTAIRGMTFNDPQGVKGMVPLDDVADKQAVMDEFRSRPEIAAALREKFAATVPAAEMVPVSLNRTAAV